MKSEPENEDRDEERDEERDRAIGNVYRFVSIVCGCVSGLF